MTVEAGELIRITRGIYQGGIHRVARVEQARTITWLWLEHWDRPIDAEFTERVYHAPKRI